MKHPDRILAEKSYKMALSDLKKAESISEAAYEHAYMILDATRKHLVAMEIKHPIAKEKKSESNYLYLANRGLA
jgi:hypothetical protein